MRLTHLAPLYLALAFGSYCIFFLLRGLRWKLLFSHSAPDVRLRSTTSISAASRSPSGSMPSSSAAESVRSSAA